MNPHRGHTRAGARVLVFHRGKSPLVLLIFFNMLGVLPCIAPKGSHNSSFFTKTLSHTCVNQMDGICAGSEMYGVQIEFTR